MNSIPKPAYVMTEPHLSGHRVVLGYETAEDAYAAHAMLSAAPSPVDEDEVERVARAIKDVVIPTTGDPLGVTIYESEAVVGSNADEAKESLIEICRIAARAAIAAMRPAPKLTEEDRALLRDLLLEIAAQTAGPWPDVCRKAAKALSLIDKLTEAG